MDRAVFNSWDYYCPLSGSIVGVLIAYTHGRIFTKYSGYVYHKADWQSFGRYLVKTVTMAMPLMINLVFTFVSVLLAEPMDGLFYQNVQDMLIPTRSRAD